MCEHEIQFIAADVETIVVIDVFDIYSPFVGTGYGFDRKSINRWSELEERIVAGAVCVGHRDLN